MPERLECEVLQKVRYINTLTFNYMSLICEVDKIGRWLVSWLSGRTLVFDRRAFAVLRSTNS